jgi:hypothetical protein
VSYFTGAVRNENTSCKAFGSFLISVCLEVFPERDLLRDLANFLIAYLVASAKFGRATTTVVESQRGKTPMRVSWPSHA